jgi:hypothetical protein
MQAGPGISAALTGIAIGSRMPASPDRSAIASSSRTGSKPSELWFSSDRLKIRHCVSDQRAPGLRW